MPSIQNGKNISIHFTEDEISLLDEFEQYRKQNYINRSGWVKQHIKKSLNRQMYLGPPVPRRMVSKCSSLWC